ncbi:MAG: FG-GAP-like repeat-containing protein [Bacteroidota bacterium]
MNKHLMKSATPKLFSFNLLILLLLFLPLSLSTFLRVAESNMPTVVGHTAGQFSVNDAGASTYNIPITISPGTGGIEPKLALSYNSQGGDGLLGTGWSLQGLSVISRSTKTLEQDNEVKGIDLSRDDTYSLDGERLVAISGNYGQEGAEYRTEQNAFIRIISYGSRNGSPERFKVWTKSGLIMEYGYVAPAQIEAEGTAKILFWLVNKVTDTKGNYYTITYQEDNGEGEYYPSRIDYTANDAASVLGFNSVQFFYENRAQESTDYISGSKIKRKRLLNRIAAFHGSSVYREYLMNYTTSRYANTYLLSSVQECADNTCFEPTTFEWLEEKQFGITTQTPNILSSGDLDGDNRFLYQGDWNGDGQSDFMNHDVSSGRNVWYLKTGAFDYTDGEDNIITTNQLASTNGRLLFGDFNGDGFSDFVWFRSDNRQNRWFINNKNPVTPSFTQYDNLIPTADIEDDANILFGDWNGDALTDVIVYKKSNGFNKFYTNTYTTGGTVGFTSNIPSFTNSSIDDGEGIFPGDWNNDRLTDLMWYDKEDGTNEWYTNNGDNTFSAATPNPVTPSDIDDGIKIDFGDFNGDGLTDLMWYDEDNGNTNFFYNKGDLTFEKATTNLPSSAITGSSSSLFVLDFNGDGASDLVYYRKSTGINKWYLNDGQCDFTRALNPSQPSTAGSVNPISTAAIDDGTSLLFGGFGDDSIIDVMWYDNASGTNRWYCNDIVRYNLLSSVTNGIGARTEITYGSLTESEIYTKENSALFPNVDFQARLPVVKSFTVEDGIGGRNEMTYCYKGAKLNVQGRGFRGFTEITTTDITTGIHETRFFEKDYRFISAPLLRTETRLSDGTLIEEKIITNGLKKFFNGSPKVHFSYDSIVITKSYELDGSLVTTKRVRQEFDDYANVTLSVVDHGDGHIDSTINTYNNFVLNGEWILGRLTRAEVHRTAPNVPSITKVAGFEYDAVSGLLTKEITEPDSAANRRIEKTYLHDAFGNILESRVIAHNGTIIEDRATYTTFSSNGRFTETVSNDLGHSESRNYDIITGYMTSQTDANGNTSTYQYDGFGRKIREDFPDGNWITYSYEQCNGNCPPRAVYYVRQEASNGNPAITYFDVLNREVCTESIDFLGRTVMVDKTFNKRGLVESVSDPYFIGDTPNLTNMTYDEIGRELTRTLPGNRVFTTTYNGLTNSTTNPLNQTKTIITNAAGRNIRVLDNQSNPLNYQYDAQGNRTHISDPMGNTIQMTYDHWGRKIQTNDPDLGEINYSYNQFDELIAETDAKNQVTNLQYDILGRLKTRTEDEGTTTWTYDTAPNGIGLVASITHTDGYAQSFTYDNLSRVLTETETIEGQDYTTSYTYDNLGRIATLTYPSGFAIKHVYNQYFYLSEIRRADNDELIWRADDYNAKGQLLQTTLGNGHSTTYTYDQVWDYLQRIQTGNGLNNVQDLSFSFNDIGHLTQRKDNLQSLTEDFIYDNLNRLTASTVAGGSSVTVQYDVLGNITFKSDVGTYTYGENGAGPHAVTSIAPVNSGVCIPSANTDFTFTSFDKVKRIQRGIDRLDIKYGAGHQRIVQREYMGDLLKETKIHVGSHYEVEIKDTLTRELHYIRAGDGVVAVYNKQSNNLNTTKYWHKDHLGSLQAITDDMGVLEQTLSYDAWGKRRNTDWTASDDVTPMVYDRGFTGHEHIDLFGLINMNGRVYDPVLGRFISADPAIQDIADLQNLNRYSYVLNNPLSYTDPSGYFFSSLWKKVKRIAKKVFNFIKDNLVTIASIAVGIATAGAFLGVAAFFNVTGFYATAFVSGAGFGFGSSVSKALFSGASLGDAFKLGIKAAVISGITAVAFAGIDSILPDYLNSSQVSTYKYHSAKSLVPSTKSVFRQLFRNSLRATVKGVAAEFQGGSFGQGFLASFASDSIRFGRDAYTGWRASLDSENTADLIKRSQSKLNWAKNPATKKFGRTVIDPDNRNIGIPIDEAPTITSNSSWLERLERGTIYEDSFGMKAVGILPGMNSLSVFHDYMADHLSNYSGNDLLYSKLTIPPAMIIEYAGLYGKIPYLPKQ